MTLKEYLIANNLLDTFYKYAEEGDLLYPFATEYNTYTLVNMSFDKFIELFKTRFNNRQLLEVYNTTQDFINDFFACTFKFVVEEGVYRLPILNIVGKLATSKYESEKTTFTNTEETVGSKDTTNDIDTTSTDNSKEYYAPSNAMDLLGENLKGGNILSGTDNTNVVNEEDTQINTTQTTTNTVVKYGELTSQEIDLLTKYNEGIVNRCLNFFEPLFLGVF